MISKVTAFVALEKSRENKKDMEIIRKAIDRWMTEELEKNECIAYYKITEEEIKTFQKYTNKELKC